MYRLQVWCMSRWTWGRNEYRSMEAANARVAELKRAGIRARVKPASELFN